MRCAVVGHRSNQDTLQLQAALNFLEVWKPHEVILTLTTPFEHSMCIACQEVQQQYIVYSPAFDIEEYMQSEEQKQEHQRCLQQAQRVEFVSKKYTPEASERIAYSASMSNADILVVFYDGRYSGRCEGLIEEARRKKMPVLNFFTAGEGRRHAVMYGDPFILHNLKTGPRQKGLDAVCIPTTSSVNKSTSELVIEENSIASQVQKRNILFAEEVGRLMKEKGTQAYFLKKQRLITFPYKRRKNDMPEKALIRASAGQAMKLADELGLKRIALPWGCYGPPNASGYKPSKNGASSHTRGGSNSSTQYEVTDFKWLQEAVEDLLDERFILCQE